ncbi:MAG: hypothetical protein K8T26_20280 [Lentisphaerae bacterium]|nr:hypothetical protein [Lentisphaerota bacterium]
MQKWRLMSLLLATAVVVPALARAESDYDFVVNAMPATILLDASGDKFSVEDSNGRVSLSELYTMPNIAAGVGTMWRDIYVDVVGGGGVLINDGFRSFMLQGIVEAAWQATDAFTIGPRLGVVYFPDPEWLDSDSVEFDSNAGLLAGLQMALGDKIKYLVSVDIMDVSFDISDAQEGVKTSDDSLNMTALAIQFGVRGEF